MTDDSEMFIGLNYELEVRQTGSSNGNILFNYLQYHNDQPMSLLRAVVTICDGAASKCASNTPLEITFKDLKMGYIPSLNSNDMISVTTQAGDVIAVKTLNTSPKAPIKYSTVLQTFF